MFNDYYRYEYVCVWPKVRPVAGCCIKIEINIMCDPLMQVEMNRNHQIL